MLPNNSPSWERSGRIGLPLGLGAGLSNHSLGFRLMLSNHSCALGLIGQALGLSFGLIVGQLNQSLGLGAPTRHPRLRFRGFGSAWKPNKKIHSTTIEKN